MSRLSRLTPADWSARRRSSPPCDSVSAVAAWSARTLAVTPSSVCCSWIVIVPSDGGESSIVAVVAPWLRAHLDGRAHLLDRVG